MVTRKKKTTSTTDPYGRLYSERQKESAILRGQLSDIASGAKARSEFSVSRGKEQKDEAKRKRRTLLRDRGKAKQERDDYRTEKDSKEDLERRNAQATADIFAKRREFNTASRKAVLDRRYDDRQKRIKAKEEADMKLAEQKKRSGYRILSSIDKNYSKKLRTVPKVKGIYREDPRTALELKKKRYFGSGR